MKRTVFTGLMVMLILSTAVTAQAAHTHEYTKQNSKVYVCECGKEKPLYSLKGERVITLNCNGGSLSAERKKVIKAACSLVGKVNYFWGGKSSAIGWDSEWGKLKTVSVDGSKTTGTKRPFGLDCSGFVTWSFINSGFNASSIGHGMQGQIAKCSRISWESVQAGDLAFYGDLSHVGIVAGKDAAGNILVIHCSSGRNNVVITTNSGFGFAARPGCY